MLDLPEAILATSSLALCAFEISHHRSLPRAREYAPVNEEPWIYLENYI